MGLFPNCPCPPLVVSSSSPGFGLEGQRSEATLAQPRAGSCPARTPRWFANFQYLEPPPQQIPGNPIGCPTFLLPTKIPDWLCSLETSASKNYAQGLQPRPLTNCASSLGCPKHTSNSKHPLPTSSSSLQLLLLHLREKHTIHSPSSSPSLDPPCLLPLPQPTSSWSS